MGQGLESGIAEGGGVGQLVLTPFRAYSGIRSSRCADSRGGIGEIPYGMCPTRVGRYGQDIVIVVGAVVAGLLTVIVGVFSLASIWFDDLS